LLVSLAGGICWSHTQASVKPLVIVKNTLELPKCTIVMQCYDNNNAFGGSIMELILLLPAINFTSMFYHLEEAIRAKYCGIFYLPLGSTPFSQQ
jgi:hypothetical protein